MSEAPEIRGTTGIDSLRGTEGDDVINPLTGAGDNVDGLGGNDRLYLDWSAITEGVIFVVNSVTTPGGTTVYHSVRGGPSGPNEVFYLNIEAFTIHGSLTVANNFSTSTSNADVYYGGSKGDTFSTGDGDDTVDIGQSGATSATSVFDTVDLGAGGNDLLIADYSSVTVGVSVQWYDSNGSSDYYSHPYGTGHYSDGANTLSFSGVERFSFTGGSGNDYFKGGDNDDSLAGGAGDDILESGKGKGTIAGGGNGEAGDRWSADLSEFGAVAIDLNAAGAQLSGVSGLSVSGIEALSWEKGGTGTIWLTTGSGNDDVTTHSSGAYADSVRTSAGDDTVRFYGGATAASTGFDNAEMGAGGSDLLVADYSAATVGISVSWFSSNGAGGDYATHPNGTASHEGTARLAFSGVDRFALTGGSGNDYFKGGDNDDSLAGGAGDDTLVSGGGNDTVVFSGNWSDYSFSTSGGVTTVTDTRSGANDGVDSVEQAETFKFANGTVAFANLGNVAPTAIALSNASLSENAANGTVVGTLSATDGNGALDKFTFSLTDTAGGRFAISGNQLVVANSSLVNAEGTTVVSITARVTDAGGLTVDKTFSISISDADEFDVGPLSDADATTDGLTEGAVANTAVGITVRGTDADSSNNAITYSLDSNANGLLTIGADGVVRLTRTVDRETDGAAVSFVARATSSDGSFSTRSFSFPVANVPGKTVKPDNKPTSEMGSAEEDSVNAGGGKDTISGLGGKDTIDGGADADTVSYAEKTAPIVVTLNGSKFVDVLVGGVIEDRIKNVENVIGGSGADKISGDKAANSLTGGDGNDTLLGGPGKDTLDGGDGIDNADYSDKTSPIVVTLNGKKAVVVKVGTANEDSIKNIENVTGGSKADKITGDKAANFLIGGAGNDTLSGAKGDDTLAGGVGRDQLIGGAGKDFFRFDAALTAGNVDRIVDFMAKDDTIQLDDAVMSAIDGPWAEAMFLSVKSGNKATTEDQRIVYDRQTGKLWYDADGSKPDGLAPVQIAQLATHPATVTWLDFEII